MESNENTASTEHQTKEARVIEVLESGTTSTREVVEALSAKGIEVASNYVDSIRADWRKGKKQTPVRDGVVRVGERKPSTALVATSRNGDKKAQVLEMRHRRGILEPAKIRAALAEEGVDISMNYIYMVLGADKKKNGTAPATRGRKPIVRQQAEASTPKVARTAEPSGDSEGIDENLLKLIQAAGMRFGLRQVVQAAAFVDQRSARLISNVFSA